MRKFRTKVGTVLAVMLCMIVALCMVSTAVAEDMSYVVQSDDGGYVANDTPIILEDDTVVVMSFSVKYLLSLGSNDIGIGVVNSDYANDTLISDDNADYGFGVKFGDGSTVVGNATTSSASIAKSSIWVEGQLYRVVFDNYTGEILIETAPENTESFTITQRIVANESFDEGTSVYFGIFFDGDASIVLNNLTYEIFKSEGAASAYAVSGKNVVLGDSENLLQYSSSVDAYYANETALNPGAEDMVISFGMSAVNLSDDATIGFAIGSVLENGRMYGGAEGTNFALDSELGITVMHDNESTGYKDASVVDLKSVFMVGYRVKAVFNAKYGAFTLLLSVSEDSAYKEVYSVKGLSFPKDNVYFGLQFMGDVDITFYGLELYVPNLPEVTAVDIYEMDTAGVQGGANGVEITEEGDYRILSTSQGVKISSQGVVTNSPIGTVIPKGNQGMVMEEGDMLAIVVENIQGYTNPSGKTQVGISFCFTRTLADAVGWGFDRNAMFSGQYETSRFNYLFNPNGKESLNQTMGDISSITDITKKGISLMAVYDPYAQIYYMYTKTAVEPDYTLAQQFNLTDIFWELKDWNAEEKLGDFSFNPTADEKDRTLYGVIRLTGDIQLTVEDMHVMKIRSSDVGSNKVCDPAVENGTAESIGQMLTANADGYYGLLDEAVVIPDNKAFAIEYEIEGVNYTNGTYNLGFLMTKDAAIFDEGELVQFPDAKYTVVNNSESTAETPEFIWSLVHYKGSNDLTPAAADTIRTIMSTAGNSIRVLFHNDGTVILQYKSNDAYTWNNLRTELALPFGDTPLYIAMRAQYTYKMDLSKIKFYMTDNSSIYDGGISADGDATVEESDEVLRFATITVDYDGVVGGDIYLADNDRLTGDAPVSGSLYADSDVTLVAEVEDGYAFDGWYSGGELVSRDPETTITVEGGAIFYAKYTTASYVYIENGFSDRWSSNEGYYADNSFVGVAPERENGYSIYGWELNVVEYDEDYNMSLLESYTITVKGHDYDGVNILDDATIDTLVSWGALVNNMSDGDVATLEVVNQNNVLTFGSFKIVDRKGFENNIIFKVPSVKSDEDAGITRQIEVIALYKRNSNVTSMTTNTEYGPEYLEAWEKTKEAGLYCGIAFFAGVVLLILLKVFVEKRKEAKKRRENEGVIADDDVTFGGSIHEMNAEQETANDSDINNADEAK